MYWAVMGACLSVYYNAVILKCTGAFHFVLKQIQIQIETNSNPIEWDMDIALI